VFDPCGPFHVAATITLRGRMATKTMAIRAP